MGCSSQASETILSWSLDRRPLKKAIQCIHRSCVMISTDNTTVVSYINRQRGTHSPILCIEVWEISIGAWNTCNSYNLSHSREIQHSCRPSLKVRQTSRYRMSLDQTVADCIFEMLRFPNVHLFATRFIHKLPLYVSPVPDDQAFAMNWHKSTCLCISTNSSETVCSHQNLSISVQNSSNCSFLASTSLVLRGLQLLVSAPI